MHDEHYEYDPRLDGAKCDECPLREARVGGPVASEFYPGAVAFVVADFPGEEECDHGRPLVGPTSRHLTRAAVNVAWHRSQMALGNMLSCRPPGNELDIFLHRLQKANKKREDAGEKPIPSPIDCCRPRLMNEVKRLPNLVTLGKRALTAITGIASPITEIRGGSIEGTLVPQLDGDHRFMRWPNVPQANGSVAPQKPEQTHGHDLRIMPTIQPAFVERRPKWTQAFQADIARAYRYFTTGLRWVPPRVVVNPSPAALRAFLATAPFELVTPSGVKRALSTDVETGPGNGADGREPLLSRLRCIGISNKDVGVSVHLIGIDGVTEFYPKPQLAEIRQILQAFLADPAILKIGWNFGYFDTLKLGSKTGLEVEPKPVLDLILVHKSVAPELSHKLAYTASVHTDAPAWKEEHTATRETNDKKLGIYCVMDTAVVARSAQELIDLVRGRGQEHVVAKDQKIQRMCLGLKRNGLFVNQKIRERIDIGLREWAKAVQEHVLMLAGGDGLAVAPKPKKKSLAPRFNPNSADQVRALLYDQWGLTPKYLTEKEEPSTGDEALVGLICDPATPERYREFVTWLRKLRGAKKLRGTYVTKARRMDDIREPDDYEEDEELLEELRERGATSEEWQDELGRARGGLTFLDGRIRPDYNAHTVVTGRLSSSGWNGQNVPSWLREMIEAESGRLLVGIDADQLELRAIASLANIEMYLDVLRKGGDPHALTATLMFGSAFTHGGEKQQYNLRRLAKSVAYASYYGAGHKKVWELVTSAEDDNGDFVNRKLTLRELTAIRERWFKQMPELPRWWDATIAQYRKNGGYLLSPVWGRRRDFLDGEEYNEILNYRIQSGGVEVIHEATFRILEQVPFERWGPGTGMVQQGHDADVFEVPEAFAPEMRGLLKEAFTIELPQFPNVTFAGKPKSGKNWASLN